MILQKGWRCLDCTVCEGCGTKSDEANIVLCDECDISYHIYCTNPPLDCVPAGAWKCKWCSVCQYCGSNSPGIIILEFFYIKREVGDFGLSPKFYNNVFLTTLRTFIEFVIYKRGNCVSLLMFYINRPLSYPFRSLL